MYVVLEHCALDIHFTAWWTFHVFTGEMCLFSHAITMIPALIATWVNDWALFTNFFQTRLAFPKCRWSFAMPMMLLTIRIEWFDIIEQTWALFAAYKMICMRTILVRAWDRCIHFMTNVTLCGFEHFNHIAAVWEYMFNCGIVRFGQQELINVV